MTIPTDIVLLGVESDDDVNKIPFVMPKEYCGYDLTTFEARINYMNANGDGDIYVVEDLAVDEEDPTKMKFTWLVGRNACMYKGNTQFIVCLKKFAADDTGTVVQEFNTTVYSLPVLQGLETTEAVEQQNADIIEYILQRIQDAGMIDPDDYYTKDEVNALIPTELPNPEALTINGQSYDGSEAVDITIEASNEVIATASGKLIHVVDAVAGEVKTLSLYDAYDTELSSGEIAVTNKNLFRIDQLADHVVSKGISFDKNEDGSITVSGTSTGTNAMTTCDLDRNMFIIGQSYTLSTSKTVGYCYVQLILTYIDGTVDYMIAMNSSRTFTIEKEVSSCVASVQLTNSGVTVDDEVVYPMLEVGSSASKFTDNAYSTMTYDGTTMPVLPAAISNVWANDDVVANMVMTYSASTILNEIDNYAEANLKSNDNSTLVALYDGVGTVMLGEDVTDPAAIPLSVEVDDTLSISGMAADAKATGDAIGAVETAVDDIEDIIDGLYPVAEVSGNPAIFDCDLAKPLVECLVAFSCKEVGTGEKSPSNPYTLVGVDEVGIQKSGQNIWNEQCEKGNISDIDGTDTWSSDRLRSIGYTPILPNHSYRTNVPYNSRLKIYYYDKQQTLLSYESNKYSFQAFTTPANAYYMRFVVYPDYGTTYNHDISINADSTDTAYHPYIFNTVTFIDLDGTRYGGYVNVVGKKGYITFVSALISSFTFQQASASSGYFRVETVSSYAKPVESTVVANILCEALPTKSNTTTWLGNTGISVNNTGRIVLTDSSCTTYEEYHNKYDSFRVVYELKTPIEIDLSDIPTLSTIIGNNSFATDADNLTLKFKESIQKYIDDKIAETQALTLTT